MLAGIYFTNSHPSTPSCATPVTLDYWSCVRATAELRIKAHLPSWVTFLFLTQLGTTFSIKPSWRAILNKTTIFHSVGVEELQLMGEMEHQTTFRGVATCQSKEKWIHSMPFRSVLLTRVSNSCVFLSFLAAFEIDEWGIFHSNSASDPRK
jgi:hypothetical protein